MKTKLNKFLAERLNFIILKGFPRHSVRFAKKYFKNKSLVVVEIGTYEGFNAKNILKVLNVEKMYLIDPYKEYRDYIQSESKQTQKKLFNVEQQARKRIKKYASKIE